MILLFLILGLVLIGFVTYGFAVVNKMPTSDGLPTREEEVNKLTNSFNQRVIRLKSVYVNGKIDKKGDEKALKELKTLTSNTYNDLRDDYDRQVKNVKAEPAKKNPIRAFWNKVIYGGMLASLTTCMGSISYVACNEEEEPQKIINTSEVWNAENIPMPHLMDENQYVANPDKVLAKSTVDSMNAMLRQMDEQLDIETAFAVVNYCEGADAFRLAQDMGNKYGVGRNDRGLVVVMAYGDHDINISPGTGLESTLSDGKCGRLLDQYAVPFLKKNQPDSAMLYLTRALLEVLHEQDELSPLYEKPASDDDRDLGIVSMGNMGLLGLLALLRRRLGKKGLMEENTKSLIPVLPNPTIELLRTNFGGYSSGGSSGRSYSSRSSSRSSSSSRGSYGGGHFGGGGASRRW